MWCGASLLSPLLSPPLVSQFLFYFALRLCIFLLSYFSFRFLHFSFAFCLFYRIEPQLEWGWGAFHTRFYDISLPPSPSLLFRSLSAFIFRSSNADRCSFWLFIAISVPDTNPISVSAFGEEDEEEHSAAFDRSINRAKLPARTGRTDSA